MRKNLLIVILASTLLVASTGCMTLTHVVGEGAQGARVEEKRQWYVLWGLVPLNEVDSHEMAEGAIDYTVTSQMTVIDGLISIVLGWISIQSQTVFVEY